MCVCVCPRAAGAGAVEWREERPGEPLTTRVGEVETMVRHGPGDGDGEARLIQGNGDSEAKSIQGDGKGEATGTAMARDRTTTRQGR